MKQGLLLEPPRLDQNYFESGLYADGASSVAGVDEAGRGCLAGPVVAASVILSRDNRIEGINDSKKLTAKKRDELYDMILNGAVSYGIGVIGPKEIDEINILRASLKAMRMAVESLSIRPQWLLVDGNQPVDIDIPQRIIVKGDMRSISVGAASIVAKVTRDRMMSEMEKQYPHFKFSVHKGYGTPLHLEELARHGPTPIHRMTFARVKTRDAGQRPTDSPDLSM